MARKTMSALSKDERAARNDRVVALLKAGKSYKEIEELEGIPKSTIGDLKKRLQERGHVRRKPGSGGVSPINERYANMVYFVSEISFIYRRRREVLRLASKYPFWSSTLIATYINDNMKKALLNRV